MSAHRVIPSHNAYHNIDKAIAHRGASGSAPENTASAIQLAADQGAQWVEVDVTISAEGVAVIFQCLNVGQALRVVLHLVRNRGFVKIN